MGLYLNSKKASLLYKDETESTYFVDKTAMLDELIPLIEPNLRDKNQKYICITRPPISVKEGIAVRFLILWL